MKTIASFLNRFKHLPLIRIFLLVLLFIIELEIVEIAMRSYYDAESIRNSIWVDISKYRGFLFSFLFVFFPAFLMISAPRIRTHFTYFSKSIKHHKWIRLLVIQLIAYIGFISLTYLLSVSYQDINNFLGISIMGWAIFLMTLMVFAFLSVAPKNFWTYLIKKEKITFLSSIAITLLITTAIPYLIKFWPSMVDLTLQFSEALLQLFYNDVFSDLSVNRLGRSEFSVRVTPACSGYEGIVLVTTFLGLYIWLFKKELRFPAVLLLFPIGIVVIWTFNVIRIATLVGIGSSFSPKIALAGFHSNAGWIAFILVSLGLIMVMHRVPFFIRKDHQTNISKDSAKMANALLIPVIVLLGCTLLTSAFSAGFDWLYPIKVLATGYVLYYFWQRYNFSTYKFSFEPVLIGIIVFIIWLILVPTSVENTAEFTSHLTNASPFVVTIWLLFRFIGSVITVPLAEELAFRGYLLNRLSGIDPEKGGALSFAFLPFFVSSLLFGIFHGAWIAGTIAGMGYAFALYRRGNIGDAVVAHVTTNALLSIYVLITQEWSYW